MKSILSNGTLINTCLGPGYIIGTKQGGSYYRVDVRGAIVLVKA